MSGDFWKGLMGLPIYQQPQYSNNANNFDWQWQQVQQGAQGAQYPSSGGYTYQNGSGQPYYEPQIVVQTAPPEDYYTKLSQEIFEKWQGPPEEPKPKKGLKSVPDPVEPKRRRMERRR